VKRATQSSFTSLLQQEAPVNGSRKVKGMTKESFMS
jgi:hypothetical protein